ncbi:MAG: type I-F CRISPR-associated protein Csy2 [Methylococcaceae bacterium]
MSRFLIIPRIKIHNANALSSPYTIGFPAMTAWFGAIHALQRKLNAKHFQELKFTRFAVSCHDINLQTYKGQGDYVHSIIGTGNPLDKNGNRPSFIEEARCHLTVSLAIEYEGVDMDDKQALFAELKKQLHALKLAGGDILNCDFHRLELIKISDDSEIGKLTRKLMTGHVLQERRDLMQTAMQNGQDAISALLSYLTVQYRSEIHNDEQVEWTGKRKTSGWIVPIATGFHGISDLGKAENQRDANTLHRFAESLVTLGEFKMPYKIKKLNELLWSSHYDTDNQFYLIQQHSHLI